MGMGENRGVNIRAEENVRRDEEVKYFTIAG